MAHKKKHLPTEHSILFYADENGNWHHMIDPASFRNEDHFQTQLTIKHSIVEDKRRKKPRHKNKDLEY